MKLLVKGVAVLTAALLAAKCVFTLLDSVCFVRHYTTVE